VEYYVGIDVSLELSSVCVKEAKVASEPEALVCFFKELGFPVDRIGFEAGPSCEGGLVGDDREDGPRRCVWACTAAAGGMVPAGARQIDWIAGDPSAAGRAQADSRKVAGCGIEHSWNPRGFGLKVGQVSRKTFEARIRELVTGHTTLERIC
jgi:transposase